MNGGYIIISDKLTDKIAGAGTYNYDGAYNYAKQLINSKKQVLVGVDNNGTVVYSSAILSKEGALIVIEVPTMFTITFTQESQNSFTVAFGG